MSRLPLYRHPTTTVILDESQHHIHAVPTELDTQHPTVTFTNAADAVEYITGAQAMMDHARSPIALDPVAPAAGVPVGSLSDGLDHIYGYVQDPQRFCAPAVVVVEYSRAAGGGMEFCEEIAHLPVKCIWRSRAAEQHDGIAAYQRGLVNRFVQREAGWASRGLLESVEMLEHEYFVELSQRLPGHILDTASYRFLQDPAFASLVQEQADRYGFVEHYLFTAPSGLLFFDADGHATLMVVQTEESLATQFEIARDAQAPVRLLQDLFKCRVVPFFGTEDGMYSDQLEDDPCSYCQPALVCRGSSDYYWALFDVPPGMRKGQAFPYARYRETGPLRG
jgi:hypothetical protein